VAELQLTVYPKA